MGLWKGIKKKASEYKQERKYRSAASKQIKKQAEAAYYQASAKERVAYAKSKARIEREAKERKLKASYKPRTKSRLAELGQDLSRGFNQGNTMMAGASEPYFKSGQLFGETPKYKPKTTIRKKVKKIRKRAKKSKGYIIRGGKAYPIG